MILIIYFCFRIRSTIVRPENNWIVNGRTCAEVARLPLPLRQLSKLQCPLLRLLNSCLACQRSSVLQSVPWLDVY